MDQFLLLREHKFLILCHFPFFFQQTPAKNLIPRHVGPAFKTICECWDAVTT
jgi:hypothetical protein